MASESRQYRAGESLEDFCRACKTDRLHTVVAADADGRPLRVACGYCRSEHNKGIPDHAGPIAVFIVRPVRCDASASEPIEGESEQRESDAQNRRCNEHEDSNLDQRSCTKRDRSHYDLMHEAVHGGLAFEVAEVGGLGVVAD